MRATSDAWGGRKLAHRLASAQRSYIGAVARQSAVNAFLDKFDLREDKARLLLDQYDFAGFISASLLPPLFSSDGGGGYRDGEEEDGALTIAEGKGGGRSIKSSQCAAECRAQPV